jgi:hypothetical protein
VLAREKTQVSREEITEAYFGLRRGSGAGGLHP